MVLPVRRLPIRSPRTKLFDDIIELGKTLDNIFQSNPTAVLRGIGDYVDLHLSGEPDPLSILNLANTEFQKSELTPTTIVCEDRWGSLEYKMWIEPIVEDLGVIVSVGLCQEGIALTFDTRLDAAKFRLFYDGDTITA